MTDLNLRHRATTAYHEAQLAAAAAEEKAKQEQVIRNREALRFRVQKVLQLDKAQVVELISDEYGLYRHNGVVVFEADGLSFGAYLHTNPDKLQIFLQDGGGVAAWHDITNLTDLGALLSSDYQPISPKDHAALYNAALSKTIYILNRHRDNFLSSVEGRDYQDVTDSGN